MSGKGCGRQAFVRFYLNDIEIDDDRADRAGQFMDNVEIPTSMDLGKAELKAGCSGYRVGTVSITTAAAHLSRYADRPRSVISGRSAPPLRTSIVLNVSSQTCWTPGML